MPKPFHFSSQNYFDPALYEHEHRVFFESELSELFLGHCSMVSQKGDYHVLDYTQDSFALVHNGMQTQIVSNICRHRHATMLQGKGNIKKIVCPAHFWSYDLDGNLKGSPGIECSIVEHSLATNHALESFGFFSTSKNETFRNALKSLEKHSSMDFSTLHYIGHESYKAELNWKEYIDTFLDCYHVAAIHPGLGSFVDTNTIHAEYGNGFQTQCVEPHKNYMNRARAGAKDYLRNYRDAFGEIKDRYAAIWAVIYPHIMIEIYQDFLIIGVTEPHDTEHSKIHSYRFCTPRAYENKPLIKSLLGMLEEVEQEDTMLMQRIHTGRRKLYQRSDDFDGPYHPQKEIGIKHFQEFLLCSLS